MIVVLTDIHGCYDEMVELINMHPKDATFVICGDLCDRGEDTYSVIEYCIRNNVKAVKGNHDQWFIEWYENAGSVTNWTYNGGLATIKSYTKDAGRLLRLPYHIKWLKSLPIYIEFKDVVDENGRHLVVSHSNISDVWHRRNESNFRKVFENIAMWSRRSMVKDVKDCYFVFGHTVHDDNPRVKTTYSNIDTGCAYGNKLTAISFPDKIIKEVVKK